MTSACSGPSLWTWLSCSTSMAWRSKVHPWPLSSSTSGLASRSSLSRAQNRPADPRLSRHCRVIGRAEAQASPDEEPQWAITSGKAGHQQSSAT